jgi:hypothetical protein
MTLLRSPLRPVLRNPLYSPLDGKWSGGLSTLWRPNLTDIPGLLFWFDPTNPAQMSIDQFGGIDLFIPQLGSSANYTLSQLVEVNRPLTIAAPSGKTIVNFPDGGRWLAKTNAPIDYSQGVSLVLAWNAIADGPLVSLHRAAGPALRFDLAINAASGLVYRYGDFGLLGQHTRPIALNQGNITTTRGREHWLNGGDPLTLSQGTLDVSTTVLMEYGRQGGGVSGTQGQMGHWLVILGPVTDEILRKIEGFIAWDLGIESSLVIDHPYKDEPPRA